MPYWGVNVRHDNYVVQAKIHGEAGIESAPDELIEYISNLIPRTIIKRLPEKSLAKFFAEKIAAAYSEHDYALWVAVDILTTEGRTFGDVRMIKEQANEYAYV